MEPHKAHHAPLQMTDHIRIAPVDAVAFLPGEIDSVMTTNAPFFSQESCLLPDTSWAMSRLIKKSLGQAAVASHIC